MLVAKREARGQGLAATLLFTIAQPIDCRDAKLARSLGMANTMQNDAPSGAAEDRQLAAQARRDAADHHVGKRSLESARASQADKGAGHKALERSQEALRKSG